MCSARNGEFMIHFKMRIMIYNNGEFLKQIRGKWRVGV